MNHLIRVATILFLIIFLISCNNNEPNLSYNLSGDWKVISFINNENHSEIIKTEENTWTQFNNGDNTVNFTQTDSTSGILTGRNVTNSISAIYKTDQNGKIEIHNYLMTEINEPVWGRLFHSIGLAESYKIKNNKLYIYYNDKKKSMIFERITK